ncbi:MAG: OsmC family protein [Polyangiaceae bacterium]|jgi:uncharacterized OsmC-like protein
MNSPVAEFALRVEQVEGFEFLVRFDSAQFASVRMDEPPPLGHDAAPNAARYLAAAVGNCLAASLVFCMKKHGRTLAGVYADVRVALTRNDERRLRIGAIDVNLAVPTDPADPAWSACRDMFEDFCVVTQSVRAGIQVDVHLHPSGAPSITEG